MQKQIEEMAEEILEEYANCYSEVDKERLEKMLLKLASEVRADTVRKIHTQMHNQAVYPSAKGDFAYIQLRTIDGILRNYLNKG